MKNKLHAELTNPGTLLRLNNLFSLFNLYLCVPYDVTVCTCVVQKQLHSNCHQ